ncbi:MAG: alpha/beta fold hydrolase [Leptolyngbya sp. RL_3_1]|nr:alpha/beta fold hydrolase [Leptolyngbya sp. RL_3_1]
MTAYCYLHGFASSPASRKAQHLLGAFQGQGRALTILDLNQGDFAHLTLSRQIQQGMNWIESQPDPEVVVIGSSFGGLTAAWLAEQPEVQERIQKLVLLAPAFQFLAQWLPRLGDEALTRWQAEGEFPIFHYGQGRMVPLRYGFITDAQTYDESQLRAEIPTLILHGRQDEVIDIQASRDYAALRPWVALVALEDDHSLLATQDQIWQVIQTWLRLG